jgi:RNA polymerase sigma factor for flagellar operon FliA
MMKTYVNAAPAVRDPERDRLIAEHVDMARRIAQRVGRRVPAHLREEDLVSAAMIGLAEAADRYDAARGEPFVAFAEKRVRGAVLDELRRGDILPRRVRTDARKVGKTIARLEQTLGRPPVDEEVAEALGVTLDVYRESLESLTTVSFVEFDQVAIDNDGPGANDNEYPVAQLERRELVTRLREAIGSLQERDAQVLSLYYVEELSYADVAEVLGVSESRVCQLHARALARLKAALREVDHEE